MMNTGYFILLCLAAVAKFQAYASETAEYWIDYKLEKCVRNCEPGSSLDSDGLCGGLSEGPWVELYDTIGDCCHDGLSWIRTCVADSLGTVFYTNKFYVHPHWDAEKCVRDCDPNDGPPCMGNPPDNSGLPTVFFDDAESCCKEKIWWTKSCVSNTLGKTQPPSPTTLMPTYAPTNLPTSPPLETCQIDSDCHRVCVTGQCVAAPTVFPTTSPIAAPTSYPTRSPTVRPTSSPTTSPTTAWPTQSPMKSPTASPTKNPTLLPTVSPTTGSPTEPPTHLPTMSPTLSPTTSPTESPVQCACTAPKMYPNKCEVEILIDILEHFASSDHALLGQWTRSAFHDAGTFDQTIPEGGANGCLLNHAPMRSQPQNFFFDAPLNTLQDAKDFWHSHLKTCISVSSADIIQFAAFFATTRQTGTPGLTTAKRNTLITSFQWGRPDEANCDTAWAENLPDFDNGAPGDNIPLRCTAAGAEIKEKMMDRNGFTAQEATALIGAHTMGSIRNTFGQSMAGPWVVNGADDATAEGPVMDNSYHRFLIYTIVEHNANGFANNVAPFDVIFSDWFREEDEDLNYLDTDISLAFPSLDISAHPHFNADSQNFANDNDLFLETFFEALDKMSKLGVSAPLSAAGDCACYNRRRSLQAEANDPSALLTARELIMASKKLGNSTAHADRATTAIQYMRMGEIADLITPVNVTISTTV